MPRSITCGQLFAARLGANRDSRRGSRPQSHPVACSPRATRVTLLFYYSSLDPILTFIQRSSYQLTTLVLLSCTISGATSMLQNIPTLAYVHITNDPGNRQKPQTLFDAMAVSTPPSMLCPNLISFVFGLRGISSAGCGYSFVSMVSSRSQPRSSPGLSFIRLFYSRFDQHRRMIWWLELRCRHMKELTSR
ncbi:hypothetical protein DFH09DRAFT_158993 [Mycena vulgaris]|nr:hypothetical protein DFH09DRAFT_158993 [Mycena vulgaris]